MNAPRDNASVPAEGKRADVGMVALHLLIGALFLFAVAQFVTTLPRWFAFLQTPCAAPCDDERLTVTQWFYAHRAGISPVTYAGAFVVQAVLLAAVSFGVATLLWWRRPRERMVVLIVVLLLLLGGTFFSIDELAFAGSPRAAQAGALLNNIGFLLLPLLFYTFPDGRFIPRWTRWVMLVVAVLLLLFATPLGERMGSAAPYVLALYALPPIYAQIYRYRHVSGPVQRQQTKWVLFGFLVATLLLLVATGTTLFFDATGRMAPAWKLAIKTLNTLGMALIPVTIGVSVLRYRLFDIDVLIRRTVQYALVVVLLTLAYSGSVLLLQRLFSTMMGGPSPLAVVLSTLAIAALFNPVRVRVHGWVEARFHRSRFNAQEVLERFTQAARDETDALRLSSEMERVVRETMHPSWVGVWLRESEERGSVRRS